VMHWYAVYTQPHAEAKAAEHLLRQGYSAYLRRYRTRVRHARRRAVLQPLFPRYLFAGVNRAAMPWRPILSTIGVTDVVRAGDEPTAVPPEVLAAIREREELEPFDRVHAPQSLSLGNQVRVTAGAFEDMVGRLAELRDHGSVVVLLALLGRAVHAQLPAEAVEAAIGPPQTDAARGFAVSSGDTAVTRTAVAWGKSIGTRFCDDPAGRKSPGAGGGGRLQLLGEKPGPQRCRTRRAGGNLRSEPLCCRRASRPVPRAPVAPFGLRVHGQGSDKYDNVRIGMNARLDTIQAAVLSAKLSIFADEIAARDRVASCYREMLADAVIVPAVSPELTSVWAQYMVRLPPHQDRDCVAARLKAHGIPTAVYYAKPLHRQTAYRDYPTAGSGLPVSDRFARGVEPADAPIPLTARPGSRRRCTAAVAGLRRFVSQDRYAIGAANPPNC
jgi:transcription elongation factor/antiterminator RfaH